MSTSDNSVAAFDNLALSERPVPLLQKPYPDVITNETDVDSYVVNGHKPPWRWPT